MTVRQSFGFPLSVEVGTHVGKIRDNNEDSVGYAWLDDGSLFVIVADGMGGHEAGEVASSLAVRVSEDVVCQDPDADPRDRLYNALLEANQAILEEGASSGTRGMGTTAIAAIIKGSQVYLGQVGDSRAYQFRRGHRLWRTTDHTRVQMLVEEGRLTEEQARHHPEAGMLTRALGHARMADGQALVPEVLDEALVLEQGDTLLLCSDGLHDLLEDEEIGRMISGKDSESAISDLIREACDRGGHDNITIAIINAGKKVQAFDPSFMPPNASPRIASSDLTQEDENPTFDFSDQGFGPPGHPGAGHLHAPTVAPGEHFVSTEPLPEPDAVAPAPSKLPLIIGGVAVVLLLLFGFLICAAGIGAYLVFG